LALEKPVAQVDGQVNLVMLWDVENVLLVLHVDRDEFVTDFGSVLSVINQTELFVLYVSLHVWIVFKSDTFALDSLGPSVLIKALSEEDDVSQYNLVIVLVNAVAHSVEVQCKDFIN